MIEDLLDTWVDVKKKIHQNLSSGLASSRDKYSACRDLKLISDKHKVQGGLSL